MRHTPSPGVRRLVVLLVAACLAAVSLVGAPAASAHPSHWLVANVLLKRDATFTVDLLLDREFVPRRFGEKSPEAEVDGLPAAKDLRLESWGLLEAFTIAFDGAPAATRASWVAPRKEEELHLALTGTVPEGARSVVLTNRIHGPWAASVRHEGEEGGAVAMLDPGEAMTPVELREGFAPKSASRTAAEFVGLGFTHIVPHGLDHMLFVLGLFLLSTRLRPLLTQVTAFTLAHTVTLGLSTAGAIRLSPSIVEPLIAASIAYVAIENLCTEKVRAGRLVLVFVFGLLHGLGFAGALAELGLPQGKKVLALLSFNAGVELGQLSVLLVAWTAVALPFRAKPWYRARVVVPASVVIAAVGLWWAVTRVWGRT
jgi:HupE / UreJ protein